MVIEDCKSYCVGTNYIVWQVIDEGIFIYHLGGQSKKTLYRMMKDLFKTEFLEQDVFFATQKDEYWRNHGERDYRFRDAEVFKYNGRR